MIVPHELPTKAAWIRPHRERGEDWVAGEVVGCWAVEREGRIYVVALVKYAEGMLFVQRLETTDGEDWIRLGDQRPRKGG